MEPPEKPDDDRSAWEQQRQTWRRSLTVTAILISILLLIWLIRSCAGSGEGRYQEEGEVVPADGAVPVTLDGDAGGLPGGDAAAPALPPCQLLLSSRRLSLGTQEGQETISIEEAVRVCQAAGKAELRVTGGATMGDYEALVSALEEAGITVTLQRRPDLPPQTGEPGLPSQRGEPGLPSQRGEPGLPSQRGEPKPPAQP